MLRHSVKRETSIFKIIKNIAAFLELNYYHALHKKELFMRNMVFFLHAKISRP